MATATIDGLEAEPRDPTDRLRARLSRPPGPKGRGQGELRELLCLISRRSESYAWRWDQKPWTHEVTDQPMFAGDVRALEAFGITLDHSIEQTDSPVRFLIGAPDGSTRTLELNWDSISYDVMSMPPHVRKWRPEVAFAVIVTLIALFWWALYAGLHALDLVR